MTCCSNHLARRMGNPGRRCPGTKARLALCAPGALLRSARAHCSLACKKEGIGLGLPSTATDARIGGASIWDAAELGRGAPEMPTPLLLADLGRAAGAASVGDGCAALAPWVSCTGR